MPDPHDPPLRKIIHIDMDAFFASVEQRDNPALRGRPVAVGGSSRRGVVAAASYEARTFGVRSAMPSVTALRRCPDLLFVKPRFDVYQQVSRQIRAIFARHTDLIEPLSLDEAYLDVSINKHAIASATQIAQMIRADIARETGLTASAGVSYNKFIAKLASDQNKPDGLCVIRPEQGPAFVAALPIKRFHGVGPRTAEKMAGLGIVTGADLADKTEQWLLAHFGSWGSYLHGAARGIDHRPVRPDRIRKSISGERTYGEDIWTESGLREALEIIADIVWERVERNEAQGRTVTLKARYADFQTITRARSLGQPVPDRAAFGQIGQALVDQILPLQNGIRLLGLTLSGLSSAEEEEETDLRQPELPFS
ncbi:MAG: DNA polymerase IV [Blastomonas fulva]|uniref:DNA polymerase IV n=1 Tax=Blastomonas fulva TaxID=1550728 RepID=UPI004033E612